MTRYSRYPFRTGFFQRGSDGRIMHDSTGQPIVSEPWLKRIEEIDTTSSGLSDLEAIISLLQDYSSSNDKISLIESRLATLESQAVKNQDSSVSMGADEPNRKEPDKPDIPLEAALQQIQQRLDELHLTVSMIDEPREIIRVLKILQVPLSGLGKAVAAPADTYLGNYLGFAFSVNDAVYYNLTNPTDWDTQSDAEFAIYWYIDEGDATKHIAWELYHTNTLYDGTQAPDHDTDTVASGDIHIPATAKYLVATTLTIPTAHLGLHQVLGLQLKRVAAVGAAPAAKPVLIGANFRYISNKIGLEY